MEDSLKTTMIGAGSAATINLGIFPDIISVLVGILTSIYLGIKIYKLTTKKETL